MAVEAEASDGRSHGFSATAIFDRWWWLVAAALVPVFVYLNLDALGMQGIYPEYLCFRRAILHGLDPAANTCQSATFPMWGYGWLLAVTRSETALLVFQGLGAVAAAWLLLRVLTQQGLLGGRPLRLVKGLLVVCIPWYAFHALRWPYSEASTLDMVSLAVLFVVLGRTVPSYRLVALSGLLFGCALNFRSDYIALPALIVLVVLLLSPSRRLQLPRLGVWLAAIVLALVPWMIYSARATGHVLVTSTNAGHVLYISLGQLPGNPWGITPSDSDPRMHRELDAHFHHAATSSLTYASDRYLRHRFVQLVRAHPAAWLHKDVVDAASTLTGGFYNGEFVEQRSCQPNCWIRYGYSRDGTSLVRSPLRVLFGGGLSAGQRLRFALQEASVLEGRLLCFVGYVLAFVLFALGLRRREPVLALLALVAVSQAAMNTFTFYLSSYSSNVIPFSIVFVGVALGRLQVPRSFPRRSPTRSTE